MFKYINSKIRLIIKIELLILATFLFIGLAQIAQSIPQVREAVALATTVRQETFTELYFDKHTELPQIVEKNKIFSFSFTVHNLESKDTNYLYRVYALFNNQKVFIDEGIISLKNDEFKSRKEAFMLTQNQRTELVVELINKNQSIHFWIEKER